ncbi:neuronal acetylcholine receptor subunit alpha-6-like [Ostrea edulis]|uniref:neuronal acetylcholine receptor subunit alpha-6-like n=1 Tax=Ostrea edulis TaxID=37623 RepID=UPI0024AFDEFE|nr:neuronal acetylcholine receptor subunit alpha-6-like [Ostrea edulis]
MIFTKVFIPICVINACLSNLTFASRTAMEHLYETLLMNYNPYVRPNSNQADNITIAMQLISINGLDELSGILSTVVYVDILWKDSRMVWNKTDYSDIRYILLPQKLVWKPDLIVTNPVNQVRKMGFDDIMIRYRNDGAALWYIGDYIETSCDIDVTHFPFDRQMCKIVMRTWNYRNHELQLFIFQGGISLLNFTENGEWIIYDTTSERVKDGPFESIHFKLYLERRSFFFIVNLFMPVLLLVLLNCTVFLLSADSGERVGYAITCLLSITVYLTLVSDTIPKTSKPISVLSVILMTLLIFSAFICFLTIIGLRFHFRNDEKPLPTWLKKLIRGLRCITSKKCYRQTRIESTENEHHSKTSTSEELMQPENRRFRGYSQQVNNNKPVVSLVRNSEEQLEPWVFKQAVRIGDDSEVIYEDYKELNIPEDKVETWKTFAKMFDKYCFILCVSTVVLVAAFYALICIGRLSV